MFLPHLITSFWNMVFVNRVKLVSLVPIAQSVEQWGSWHPNENFAPGNIRISRVFLKFQRGFDFLH